jgi:hypothetical protein
VRPISKSSSGAFAGRTRALFLARFLICALALPLLVGCDAIVRHNGDYFEAGTDVGAFQLDDQACGTQARDEASYTLRGLDGTGYDQTRAYNSVYGRCMQAHGHPPRAYSRNWLPQR